MDSNHKINTLSPDPEIHTQQSCLDMVRFDWRIVISKSHSHTSLSFTTLHPHFTIVFPHSYVVISVHIPEHCVRHCYVSQIHLVVKTTTIGAYLDWLLHRAMVILCRWCSFRWWMLAFLSSLKGEGEQCICVWLLSRVLKELEHKTMMLWVGHIDNRMCCSTFCRQGILRTPSNF